MKLFEPTDIWRFECGSNDERVAKAVDIYVTKLGIVPDTVFVPPMVWEQLKMNAREPGHWSIRFDDNGVWLMFGMYGKIISVLPRDGRHIIAYDQGKEEGVRIGAYMSREYAERQVELVEVSE